MLTCLTPKISRFSKHSNIRQSGNQFDGIGIILDGVAVISKESNSGNRIVMNILNSSNVFGEIIAFSSNLKWPANVDAQTDCTVMFIPKDKIIHHCHNACPWHRQIIQNLLNMVSDRALMLNKKVEYLSIKSIRGKLSLFILDEYKKIGKKDIMLSLNRNELADFLYISRPSMSREMGKMRDEGIIDFYLSSIKILDIEALKTAEYY